MINPFTEKNDTDSTDISLVESAQNGDREALERLILRHQAWIYNIALRMVLNPHDTEDATQEILIKIITKLSTFKGKSSFRTWLYRIVVNHVINMKKGHCENKIIGFKNYGEDLDKTPDIDLPDRNSMPVDIQVLIEEAKIGCMMGMLLCLDREQRIAYILGEIFNVNDSIGSMILEISKENFRQRVSRARRDLQNFMNEKCGLINQNNPCRCAKKTTAWVRAGLVEPDNLKFNKNYVKRVKDVSENKSKQLEGFLDNEYSNLFREHPFQDPPDFVKTLERILHSEQFQQILNLTPHH
ncbi:MAG: RNA polymerase sigma factor [Nitrospinae bacterium]|nr:RNA polymerase sigma factor [Nitrospinota bacterium]